MDSFLRDVAVLATAAVAGIKGRIHIEPGVQGNSWLGRELRHLVTGYIAVQPCNCDPFVS
jgi:hypothetical protein